MEYTKMHGTQNKFLVFDNMEEPLENPQAASIELCRKEDVDGIILVMPPKNKNNDFMMRIFNRDGSEAEMCGNGIRCFARYVFDSRMTEKKMFNIETLAGLRVPEIISKNMVKVDMDEPKPGKMNERLVIGGREFAINTVSMGNPHCVIFVDRITDSLVLGDGPRIEVDKRFSKKTNVEFIRMIDDDEIEMRVWERGTGETMACGTGACASVVAAVLNGKSRKDGDVKVHLLGGDLVIRWNSATDHVFMTGNAEYL
ncbi:diaminopimelate epimerase [Candidatus Woesearchaeota archaeon CG10_big_fil_rev_8_21_14_0_10_44_13]|nr:MAG: diaminopimelate epimerase [Candidatus Woesearchaeota archaeon CG10_big_fil_rev_8_21_14_0_10_44_13]